MPARVLSFLCLIALTGAAVAEEYLTADGKLTQTLVVKDLQGGFVGFTGKQYTVEPSGKWMEDAVTGVRLRTTRSGTLDAEQLRTLGAELKKYGAATLTKAGMPTANPRVIAVAFGKHSAELTMPAKSPAPEADPKTVEGRFGGVLKAVRTALPKPEKKKK